MTTPSTVLVYHYETSQVAAAVSGGTLDSTLSVNIIVASKMPILIWCLNSPNYSQSNELVEKAVVIAKNIVKKCRGH